MKAEEEMLSLVVTFITARQAITSFTVAWNLCILATLVNFFFRKGAVVSWQVGQEHRRSVGGVEQIAWWMKKAAIGSVPSVPSRSLEDMGNNNDQYHHFVIRALGSNVNGERLKGHFGMIRNWEFGSLQYPFTSVWFYVYKLWFLLAGSIHYNAHLIRNRYGV